MATAPIKTDAELALIERFSAEKSALPGAASLRQSAFEAYAANGLPHRRVEDWKWTDLRANLRAIPAGAGVADPAVVKAAPVAFPGVESRKLIIANGRFVPALSDLAGLEKGVEIRSIATDLASGDSSVLAVSDDAADNVAVQLNTAFVTDGLIIDIAEGATLSRPLELVHVTSGNAASVAVRHRIKVSAGAKATVLVSYEAATKAAHQVNAVISLDIGDEAELNLISLQDEPEEAVSFITLDTEIAASAKVSTFHVTLGAGLARSQIFASFEGRNAEAHFRGVSLLSGKRLADTTLVITHNAENCVSREVFKAAVNDSARSVFQGKIKVPAHAQKTDARMMNASLLLSEWAEVNSKPELEIFADDVQCGHGATCGELDDDQLFYLTARGIPKAEAKAMLVLAFLAETLDEIALEPVRDLLVTRIESWLHLGGAK